MADGIIKESELIESKAAKVYENLAKSAKIHLGEIIKDVDKLNLAMNKFGVTSKEAKVIQEKHNIAMKKAEKELIALKIATSKVTLEQKKQTLTNAKLTEQTKKQTLANKNNTKSAKTNTKAIQQTADAYQKLKTRAEIATQKAKNLGVQFGINSRQAKKAALSARKLDTQLKQVGASTQSTSLGFTKLGASIKQAFSRFIGFTIVSTLIFAIARSIADMTRKVVEFDKSMIDLSAVLGNNRKELKGLNQEIIRVASISVNTSNDVAKLAVALATLGKTKDEIRLLLEPVNSLAIGLDSTSEEAGNLLVATLNAFGKGASSATKFANIIANMRVSTSLDFEKIKDSLGFLAPTAKAAGLDLAETGAILGVLVSNGIKASRAGRLAGASFLRLAKQGKTVTEALDEVNIAQQNGVKETDLLALSTKLFGVNAGAIGLILANNRDRTEELTQKFREQNGVLDDLVNDKLKSIQAQIKITDSLWERFILRVDNGTGSMSKFAKKTLLFMDEAIRRLEVFSTSKDDAFEFKKFDAETQGIKDAVKLVNDELETYGKLGKKVTEKQVIESNLVSQGKKWDEITLKIKNSKAVLELLGDAEAKKNVFGVIYNKREIEDRKKLIENGKLQIQQDEIQLELINGKLKGLRSLQAENNKTKTVVDDTGSTKKSKQFADLEKRIQAQRIQGEINANKEIINSDKTLYTEKIRLLEDNKNKEVEILDLLKQDKIDLLEISRKKEIDKADKTGAKILDINKFYDDSILLAKEEFSQKSIAIQTQTSKSIESIIKKEASQREKSMRDTLSIIRQTLNTELKLNKKNLRNGQITRREKIDADKKAYQKANAEALPIIEESFSRISTILEAAGLPTQHLTDLIKKLKEAFRLDGGSGGVSIQKQWELALQFASDALGKINELTANASQAKINAIKDEISAEEDKFSRLKELAGNDAETQKVLDKEKEARIKILKNKERKEKEKQWKLDKKISLAQIAIDTAVAVMKVTSKGGIFLVPSIIALGALEAAVVLSTPMPQFAKGGVMGYDGKAMINDGGNQEYVERGGQIYTSSKKNAIVDLQKGDIIHRNRDILFDAINIQNINGESIDLRTLDVLTKNISRDIERGFKKARINISQPNIELGDELWRLKQHS